MEREPRPYEIYRHFKGNLYQILNIALDSETGGKVVVYQALYGDFPVYVRPMEMFISPTDRVKYPLDQYPQDKYPYMNQYYRFQLQERPLGSEAVESVQRSGSAEAVESVQRSGNAEIPVQEAEEDFVLDPVIQQFLDADTYEEKLNMLVYHHSRISHDIINTMAAAIDIEIRDGELEDRYEEMKNCLITMEKFECNRLR